MSSMLFNIFSEHQELAQKLGIKNSAKQPSEKQLQLLTNQMESKAEQINIVSRQLCETATSQKQHLPLIPERGDFVRPKDANVKFLRRIKAIKSTLQQKDLSWD